MPQSSYRLQLQPGFGFADAAAIASYLASLGVTHAYLSPILQAAPGSVHGYDVVDHSRVSDSLGGEGAFRDMVAEFRRHGLGVIADIVPNHMAIGAPESLNRQFWSVLRDGAGSRFAHWFDIDWPAGGGRLLLPILAGPPGDWLGDLTVDAGEPDGPVLRYHEHVLPVRPGTEDLPLPDLAAAQHYRLADWRAAATELNWRRFFDVTSLIAVRVEDEDVFAATHGLLLRLMAEGLIDGLRADHPDGLADPRGYLDRLAKATGGAWVVTEKILTGTEELPPDWKCAGTRAGWSAGPGRANSLPEVPDVRDLLVPDERRVSPALRGLLGPDLDQPVGDHDRDDRAADLLAFGAASLLGRGAGPRRARVPLARPADGGLVEVASVGVDQRARGPGPRRPWEHARLVHPVGVALGHCIRRSPRCRGCVAASLPRVQVKSTGGALPRPSCDRLS